MCEMYKGKVFSEWMWERGGEGGMVMLYVN